MKSYRKSTFILLLRFLRRLLSILDYRILSSLLFQYLSSLLLPFCQKSWIYLLQLRKNARQKRSKFRVVLNGISMNGESSKQLSFLKMLKFFKILDEVDMQIQILQLRQTLQFFADISKSIMWKINPNELFPFISR